jgi:hypothetical protein
MHACPPQQVHTQAKAGVAKTALVQPLPGLHTAHSTQFRFVEQPLADYESFHTFTTCLQETYHSDR